jgi:flagellar motor protein MotB
MKQEAERKILEIKQEVANLENKLNQREISTDKRDASLINKENIFEEKNELLNGRLKECDKKEARLKSKIDSIIFELEKIAQLSVKKKEMKSLLVLKASYQWKSLTTSKIEKMRLKLKVMKKLKTYLVLLYQDSHNKQSLRELFVQLLFQGMK